MERSLLLFKESTKSQSTFYGYIHKLGEFMRYCNISSYDELSRHSNLQILVEDWIKDPNSVVDENLKQEMLQALQISKFKPEWEALEWGLEAALKQKKLEAGWREDFKDFNIKHRLKDNDTQSAINKIDEVIEKLEVILK